MLRGCGTTTRSMVMTAVLGLGIAIAVLSLVMAVGPALHTIVPLGR